MSSDPRINQALFNFCIAADDGPRQQPEDQQDGNKKQFTATPDDLKWLREALSNVEAPDRIMQRHVGTLMEWSSPLKEHIWFGAAKKAASNKKTTSKNVAADYLASVNKPPLMLPAPPGSVVASGSTAASASENTSATENKKEEEKKEKETSPKIPSNKQFSLSELPKIEDKVLEAAEELADLCEDLNYAKEFMLLKGVPLFLGLIKISSRAAISSSSDKKEKDLQNQWTELRTILTRCLAGSSANFDEFQLEMCKFDFASVFVPLLSKKEEFCVKFPAELSAILLCLTNTIRAFPPALNEFLFQDGMFHLASCVEFLRDKNSGSLSSLENHFVVALRRAFSFARYLVEEHAVTSPRVLKAAADLIVMQSLRALPNKDSKAAKNKNQDDENNAEELTDEDRHLENLHMAASFGSFVLVSALQRSAVTEKQLEEQNSKNKQVSGVNLMLQQWGRYVAQKFSTSSSWWEKFGPSSSESAENLKLISHHSLQEGVESLTKALIAVKKEMPSLADEFSCFV